MSKITLKKPYPLIHPNPIVLIGVKHENHVNFTTIGDVAVAGLSPALIMISMNDKHYSTELIRKAKRFSINIPTRSMVQLVDYCGVFSGNQIDKQDVCDYELVDEIPIVKEAPIHLICTIVHRHQIKQRVIMVCEVEKTMVDESLLKEQGLDLSEFSGFVYGLDNQYYGIGESFATGYDAYKKGTFSEEK